jgi:hypothetical protein
LTAQVENAGSAPTQPLLVIPNCIGFAPVIVVLSGPLGEPPEFVTVNACGAVMPPIAIGIPGVKLWLVGEIDREAGVGVGGVAGGVTGFVVFFFLHFFFAVPAPFFFLHFFLAAWATDPSSAAAGAVAPTDPTSSAAAASSVRGILTTPTLSAPDPGMQSPFLGCLGEGR